MRVSDIVRAPGRAVRGWRAYSHRQQELLRASNHPVHPEDEPVGEPAPGQDHAGPGTLPSPLPISPPDTGPMSPSAPEHADQGGLPLDVEGPRYGEVGKPINRHSPFYLGFWGATGVLFAMALWSALGQLATTITILLVAVFLTLALNPLVEWLMRHDVRRGFAVGVVFASLLLIFVFLGLLVVPPVLAQGTDLAQNAPDYLRHFLDTPWVRRLDADYHVIDKIQTEFQARMTDQAFISQVLGGILGAGKVVASGIFQTLTILILTLYFLTALPTMKKGAYAVVPASRRTRVASLSEEIMRRVGAYAIGQVGIATLNAFCSWVMMSIIGIPYAAVLAVAAGFLGLIPLIGATLGATVVTIVAFFHSPTLAIVTVVYYTIYQQIENYVIAPRVMQRTVSVPGALTIVAALTGGTLLGMVGALLAIPVAAGLLLLYEEVLVPRMRHA